MKQNKTERYDHWVGEVCLFLSEAGPKLDRCCSVMQSKPVLDKSPEVVFLGYNAHEDWGYCGIDRQRFYDGNPDFYAGGGMLRMSSTWKVWSKLYGAMQWADCTRPMEEGNFVFMNSVYFGSTNIAQLKSIPDSTGAIDKCLRFTEQVVTHIFRPKIVICLSINDVFDPLAPTCGFREIETLHPINGTQYVSSKAVKRAWWGSCRVIGIPHPSQAISYDDLGSIALFIKQELTRE